MSGIISMTVIYGVAVILSFILMIGYCVWVREKEIWLLLLHFAVLGVNAGYFMLSVSRTLSGALFSNRIAYLGSVFLPLCMLMTIIKVCKIACPNWVTGILFFISIAVFFLAASGGYLDLYYKEVSIEFINGAAKLVKEYGPLHCLYLVYLLLYFFMMIAVIFYSTMKKDGTPHKLAIFLAAVVLGNVVIWFVEQLIPVDFEFLSVSYVFTELLLLLLYCMIQDGGFTAEYGNRYPAEDCPGIAFGDSSDIDVASDYIETDGPSELWNQDCEEIGLLTARELEVLTLIMQNKKRKEIAEELHVSENTIKKHTSHIFSKLAVANRKELYEKIK